MNRNGDCSRLVSGINKNVMTADNSMDDKTPFRECLDDTPTANDWQPSTPHTRRLPLRGGFRDERRKEVPFPVLADILGLPELPPRHWRAPPVRYRPR